MRKRLSFFSFLCVALLLVGVAPARAQGTSQSQPKISITATAGYGDTGAYLLGEWLPVRVTLTNPQGGQSRRVTVRVLTGYTQNDFGGVYEREVDLPAPSRKEITLYTYDSSYTRYFLVKLFDGDKELETITVNAEPFEPPSNLLVGVASSDSSLLNVLKGEKVGRLVEPLASVYGYYGPNQPPTSGMGTATIAHITLTDIPALSQALDTLGAIVLDDVDTGTLSEEQRAALEAWVARGGMLIATFRPGGVDTLAGLGDLPPVTVSGSRNVSSLSSLGYLVNMPITTTGTVAVGNAQLKDGVAYSSRALAMSDGTPLVAVRELGQGHVVYLGLSPALPPLKGWEGTVPLFKRILAYHELQVSYGGSLRSSAGGGFTGFTGIVSSSMFGTSGGLFALPGLELPDPWLIGGFLLLYIIIVGPVNFIILRRMRRAELAWITIPVLVALFSGVAYVLALGSKGGELVSIRANAIQTAEGTEQASLAQYFGLYSPARRTYSLELNTDSVLTEINPFGYYQSSKSSTVSPVIGGNGTTLVGNVNIDTWSLRAFLAQHTARLSSPLEADIHLGDNEIVGTVKNRTNGPLEDVVLIRGKAVQYIGLMAPGETANVHMNASTGLFNNSSPQTLLPPPAGVAVPQSASYYGPGGNRNNQAQRLYDRRIELLSGALYPLISGEPPTDMRVTMVAWGPSAPRQFGVPGYTTSVEEVNVWTGTAQVRADDSDQPRFSISGSGSVPFTIYAPGNDPAVLPMGRAYSGANSALGQLYFGSGQYPPVPSPVPTATPLPGQPGSTAGVRLAPYADLEFHLPTGTKPSTLTLKYTILNSGLSSDAQLDLLAYNVGTGNWDRLAGLERGKPAAEMSIPDPRQYTDGTGGVTLRVLSSAGEAVMDSNFDMALNSDE